MNTNIVQRMLSGTGAFFGRRVLGPKRLDRDDPPLQLWLIVMIALAMMILLPAAYVSSRHGEELAKLSADERAQWRLPASDVVIISVFLPVISFVAIFIADENMISGGIRKLGMRGGDGVKRAMITAVIGAAVAIPMTLGAAVLVQWVWNHWSPITPEEHQLITQLHDMRSPIMRAMIVFAAVIGAPVYEELLFRGHLQTAAAHSLRFLRRGPAPLPDEIDRDEPAWVRWCAIGFAAALFAVVHATGASSLWMLPPLFLLAVCFGYVYERTGNLWAPIFMHAAFNATSVLLALLKF